MTEGGGVGEQDRAASRTRRAEGGPGGEGKFRGVVYIGGVGHSGSTLLDLVLNNHPLVHSTGEVHRLNAYAREEAEPCTCGRSVAECPFWRVVEEQVREWRGLPGYARPLLTDEVMIRPDEVSRWRGAVEKVALLQPSLGLARGLARVAAPLHHRAALTSFEWYRAIREATGAAVVVDSSKDPRRLKWLYTVAPEEYRLIHLIRDGRAVAASGIRRTGRPMEEVARKWRALQGRTQAVQRSIPDRQKIRVKYEALCADPGQVLREIFEFLGLPSENGTVRIDKEDLHNIGGNAMRFRSAETTIRLDDRWTRELTAEHLATFDRIAGRLNRRLGYD